MERAFNLSDSDSICGSGRFPLHSFPSQLTPLMADRRGMSTDMVETDLFEHREVKPHFINPCCFGEDFASWLKQELSRSPDYGNFMYGATGAADYMDLVLLQLVAQYLHNWNNDPINSRDIMNGYYVVPTAGTLTIIDYNPPAQGSHQYAH